MMIEYKIEMDERKTGDLKVSVVACVGMVMVECLDVGLTTLSKAAMSKGMSHFVFVVYSNSLATLILLPSSLFFHRTTRPPLTPSLLCKFFVLALIGITVMQNSVFTGVNYSSPTLGSAISNLIPAFTFLLAILFRMEKINLRRSRSWIKIMGTLLSISGAMVVKPCTRVWRSVPYGHNLHYHPPPHWQQKATGLWEATILKEYPSEMIIVAFYCLFGTLQCAFVSLVAERDHPNVWKITTTMELIAIVYSAVFGNAVSYCVQTWCIYRKGPVFVSMFKPLGVAIAALFGVVFLGDTLWLGSVIGAIVIVMGYYGVILGQTTKEEENGGIHAAANDQERQPLDSTNETPLLIY